MNKLLLLILLITISSSTSAQKAFSSLEEQMNSKEFNAAGLEKLTPEELDVLNNWIRGRSLVTLDAPKAGTVSSNSSSDGEDGRGFEVSKKQKMSREPISSRLVGTFTGWDAI